MANESKIIAVDFDGTVVKHKYPQVGEEVPRAVEILHRINQAGHRIILYTMRSGQYLKDAQMWYEERSISLWGVNENSEQKTWTDSSKVYAHYYIDDAAIGCPLIISDVAERPFVDWQAIGRHLWLRDLIKLY